MNMYDAIAKLTVHIESFELEPLQQKTPSDYTRLTTVVRFRGNNQEGVGEDVTYGEKEQLSFREHGPSLDFRGTYTIAEFSQLIAEKQLFHISLKPSQEAFRLYRIWTFESAALDLALKQANTTLAAILTKTPKPLNFVSSVRVDNATGITPLQERITANPDIRFKLDPLPEWSEQLIQQIADLGRVDVLDLKGHYKGTSVDVETDPRLYQKLLVQFPNAIFEDPSLTKETLPLLKPHVARISWDAPVHSLEEIKAMPIATKWLNIKPSRFGTIQELLRVYEYCMQNDITMYGGGQFELGPGRRQIQYLASLFHPNTPNDTAPSEYNFDPLPKILHCLPLSIDTFS